MKSLLKLEAWQLFLLMWGIPLLTPLFPLEKISPAISIGITLIFGFVFFLWLYAIGTLLPSKLNSGTKIPDRMFKFHFVYIFILMIVLIFAFMFKDKLNGYGGLLFLFVLYYFVSVFIIFRFTAKTIASVEMNKLASASDYIGYFFLIWFSPVGIWIIQPKIRKYFI